MEVRHSDSMAIRGGKPSNEGRSIQTHSERAGSCSCVGSQCIRVLSTRHIESEGEPIFTRIVAEPDIGTLPRFFARMEEHFLHLTRHWLRLVEESEDANRSRWLMHSTWQQLREAFRTLAGGPPLDDEKRTLVRGTRYRGRMRLLRRMEAGVIRSLEVEDASPTSTVLMTMSYVMVAAAVLAWFGLPRRRHANATVNSQPIQVQGGAELDADNLTTTGR